MRIALAVVLTLHALIHLLGFLKAFELARLTQLAVPISRPMGAVWLAAAALLLGASVALFALPRWFWLLGALGVLASQLAITASWADARFGTAANVLTLLAVVYGSVAWGPFGLRAEYQTRTSRALAQGELRHAGRPNAEAFARGAGPTRLGRRSAKRPQTYSISAPAQRVPALRGEQATFAGNCAGHATVERAHPTA